MGYELQAGEALPLGIKRIAYEQIDEALNYLQEPNEDNFDDAVHETRKCMKKLRGLLRLVRKEIGEEVFNTENGCFRDAARLLSHMRDKRVMIDVFDEIKLEVGEGSDAPNFEKSRETLWLDYKTTKKRVIDEEKAQQKAAVMLQSARLRVEEWPIDDNSFGCISGGLRKVYKRGRNRLRDAEKNPTAETLHEWRKRVKYLWYNIRIIQPVWPEMLGPLSSEIDNLGDYLGIEHDLAELKKLILHRTLNFDDKSSKMKLLSHIEQRRSRLQEQAFAQGHRVYAETPKKFITRMSEYWHVAPASQAIDIE